MIRTGFIYKPANVALVGDSVVLADESPAREAFADAREPLAQAFKKVGSPDADAFAVIVNHFKSKGSGTADPDGQGNANDRRDPPGPEPGRPSPTSSRRCAASAGSSWPVTSTPTPKRTRSRSSTRPATPTWSRPSTPSEESYNFDGQIGSLDHVLANSGAIADVNGVDIWTINSYESVYYEYSRFNYNVTNLYDTAVPVLRPQPGDRRDQRRSDRTTTTRRRDGGPGQRRRRPSRRRPAPRADRHVTLTQGDHRHGTLRRHGHHQLGHGSRRHYT